MVNQVVRMVKCGKSVVVRMVKFSEPVCEDGKVR